MKHVFYILILLPIWWEFIQMTSPKRVFNFKKEMKKAKDRDNYNSTQKSYGICAVGYFLWTFAGLFSFQWPLFILMLLLGTIPKKHYLIIMVDGFISTILLLFMLINAYHLKIDIFTLIRNLF